MTFEQIANEVMAEVQRAQRKHSSWPTDPIHAAAIVAEEAGELVKAVTEHTYEPHKSSLYDVRAEAIETATAAFRFLMSLERYYFSPCAQHSQDLSVRMLVACWKCRTCGCLWHDNLDGSVSLWDTAQRSCEICENLVDATTCTVDYSKIWVVP